MKLSVFAKEIIKIPFYLLGDVIYLLCSIIPKKKNLWLIGSWLGEKFNDNSRHFYEYLIQKKEKNIEFYWITKNKEIFNHLREKGLPVTMMFSIRGLWLTIRAKVVIMSSNLKDISFRCLLTKDKLKVQLWHGIPVKKIGFDSEIGLGLTAHRVLKILFPFYYKYRYDLFPVTSKTMQNRISSAFKIGKEQLPILGSPRTDIFFNKNNQEKAKQIQILYVPTFRRQGQSSTPYYLPDHKALELIEKTMKEINGIFKIKLHFLDEKFIKGLDLKRYKRIKLIDADPLYDLQRELVNTNILITDYSSVIFDFLLLNRSIIFSAFDLEEYITKDQGLYEDFNKFACGDITKNWEEVINSITRILKTGDIHQAKREEVKNRYWDKSIQNGESSKRILEEIKNMIGL